MLATLKLSQNMLWIVGSPGEILPDRSPAAASHKGCWANIKKKDPQDPQESQYEEIKNYQEAGSANITIDWE